MRSGRRATTRTPRDEAPGHADRLRPLARAASAKIPVVFDATTPANVLRALSLAKEFNLDAMVVGSGADDEVLAGIKAAGRPVIVSMAFPDKPEIDDADEALDTSHETLRRYVAARATRDGSPRRGSRSRSGRAG